MHHAMVGLWHGSATESARSEMESQNRCDWRHSFNRGLMSHQAHAVNGLPPPTRRLGFKLYDHLRRHDVVGDLRLSAFIEPHRPYLLPHGVHVDHPLPDPIADRQPLPLVIVEYAYTSRIISLVVEEDAAREGASGLR